MTDTIKTIVMHLPCAHVSCAEDVTTADLLDGGKFESLCPICLSSTEEQVDVTQCLSTIETQKFAQEVCSKLPKTFFWPCQHNFFCQSCAETHFECEKTGREKCLCGELIEGIYTMVTTDEHNEARLWPSAL